MEATNMTVKKTLKSRKTPSTNCNASRGTRSNSKQIKSETPLDHTEKRYNEKKEPKTVGISLGITKNMDNYESLRIDVWCTDMVLDSETFEQAFERVSNLVKARIDMEIEEITGE